jgi:hypothetical protein
MRNIRIRNEGAYRWKFPLQNQQYETVHEHVLNQKTKDQRERRKRKGAQIQVQPFLEMGMENVWSSTSLLGLFVAISGPTAVVTVQEQQVASPPRAKPTTSSALSRV